MKTLSSISNEDLNDVTGGFNLASCSGKVIRNAVIGELVGTAAGAATGVAAGYGVAGAAIGALYGAISAGPVAATLGVAAAGGSSSCFGS
jgi:hypothetical protein